ncbi:MAG: undecaprenyl-diphosphatase UppP [Candidatus Omnitrophica bacterium]|nr:undecaprenyl-diphosphatase UppP [Candidatus Omnitrophota bacterium]
MDAIWLGMVQGLTEFLPISSSGHLVLFQHLFGLKEPMLDFDVTVHLGTLFAVLIYFRRELYVIIDDTMLYTLDFLHTFSRRAIEGKYPNARFGAYIILATIPAGLMGFLFKDRVESLFGSVFGVGIAWMVMGAVLLLSRGHDGGKRSLASMKPLDALLIGFVQGIALIPGISRSGSTILGGMFLGIEKKDAARFSFLIAVPAILGASLLELGQGGNRSYADMHVLLVGFFVSAIVGYFAIAFLLRIIERSRFFVFGYYCLAIGVVALACHFFIP